VIINRDTVLLPHTTLVFSNHAVLINLFVKVQTKQAGEQSQGLRLVAVVVLMALIEDAMKPIQVHK